MEEKEKIKTEENTTLKSEKKSIIRIIFQVLSWIIIFLLLIIIIRVQVFKQNNIFGYKAYIIGSGSMEPTIYTEDVVIVKKEKQINKNDIIAFKEENTVIVHRVVDIVGKENEQQYKTKGDNNNVEDGKYISESNIEGTVKATIPKAGKASSYIREHMRLIAAIFAILIILILVKELILKWKTKEK